MAEKELHVIGQSLENSSTESTNQVRLDDDAVFKGGAGDKFYEPIPEYEGFHRYDPKFEWDEKEETRLVRRVSSRHFHPASP